MKLICFLCLILKLSIDVRAKWVRDVDSKIVEEIERNPSVSYLIKFYAPWCGHCRKFEPIYEEIGKEIVELSKNVEELKNIQIVRIDATIYSDVGNRYDVRGYPTLKLIRGSQIFSYENERTKNGVIEFLRRVNGPALRWIPSLGRFNEIRREHEVFFLFLTNESQREIEENRFFKLFNELVQRFLSQTYFFATNVSLIHQTYFSKYQTENKSLVFAIKSEGFYLFRPDFYQNSLETFVLKEKVPTFPQVHSANIHDLIVTKKLVIIYAFKDQHELFENKQKRIEFKTQMRNYVHQHLSTLRETHQFSWSNDLELLSNIAVWTLDEPLIFLYDSNEHKYGIYPLDSMISKSIQLESILDYIVRNSSEILQYSGDTWLKRICRPFWELYRTIIAMFIEAPFVSLLIIGIPTCVITLICYCLCCVSSENPTNQRKSSRKKSKSANNEDQDQTSLAEDEDDDDEYEERIVHVEPKFIKEIIKPLDAREIETWPKILDENRKSPIEKKND